MVYLIGMADNVAMKMLADVRVRFAAKAWR